MGALVGSAGRWRWRRRRQSCWRSLHHLDAASSRSWPMTGVSSMVTSTCAGSRPAATQCCRRMASLRSSVLETRGKIAAIAEPAMASVRFSPLLLMMTGIRGTLVWVTGGFRQVDPLAAILPGAGLPQGAECRTADSSSSNRAGPGTGRPNPACSRSHQPCPCRRTIVRRSARQAWPRSWPGSPVPGTLRVSPACPGEEPAPGPRASRVSPTAPGSAPRRGQPGGSGSGDPSTRFPAGQPRQRRGPPPPASAPGLPGPHPGNRDSCSTKPIRTGRCRCWLAATLAPGVCEASG